MSGYRSSGQQQPSTVKVKSYIAETYLTEKDRRALFVHSRESQRRTLIHSVTFL